MYRKCSNFSLFLQFKYILLDIIFIVLTYQYRMYYILIIKFKCSQFTIILKEEDMPMV